MTLTEPRANLLRLLLKKGCLRYGDISPGERADLEECVKDGHAMAGLRGFFAVSQTTRAALEAHDRESGL